jgi:hypothetical protein
MPSERWLDVSYEDLTRRPLEEIERIYAGLGLRVTEDVRAHAARLSVATAPTALTAPWEGKWREQNEDAVSRILPLVAGVERRLGYGA